MKGWNQRIAYIFIATVFSDGMETPRLVERRGVGHGEVGRLPTIFHHRYR